MKAKNLFCNECKKKYPLKDFLTCECGGILEVEYNYTSENIKKLDKKSMWDYFNYLPIDNSKNIISLGEGLTPLIKLNNLSKKIEINELFVKNESCNPTASFKDRPVSTGISKAKELGKNKIITASSGNAAASVAAYSAKAGMLCKVVVPEKTPNEKLKQIKAYGAEIVRVKGDYSNSYDYAIKESEQNGFYNLTTTYLNPYSVEGDKTVAYELFEELGLPEYIFVPVGAGPLLHGILKGYKELMKLKKVHKLPKMVAVQPEKCAPIVEAFDKDKKSVKEWQHDPDTIASGINDPLRGYKNNGTLTLKSIYESNGYAIKLSDKKIIESVELLAQNEGIYAEPAGAVGIGATINMVRNNIINTDDKVVIMVTGHGLKNAGSLN